MEVTLGRSDIDVTEVSRKLWKQSLDVLARVIPRDNTVHGRRVAKIMETRGAWFADRAPDTSRAAYMLKHSDDAWIGPSANAA